MKRNLTAIGIQALKSALKPYKKTDGGGLYLEVLPSGTMVWRYQYQLQGKRERVTIGPYRHAGSSRSRVQIDLEKARDLRNEYRKMVRQGESPAKILQAKKAIEKSSKLPVPTFRDLATNWVESELDNKSSAWRYTVVNWLKKDILPALGEYNPVEISEGKIQALVESVEARGAPASAAKVRTICKHIFAYAKRKREVIKNPVDDVCLVRQPKTRNHRPLTVREIGPFLNSLDRDFGREGNKLAIYLLALTLVRKDELRLAKWIEIDFDLNTWIIPAHRMKMQIEHKVSLSRQAQKAFTRLKELSGSSEYVLPHFSTVSRPIGHTTLNNTVDRLDISGARFVPHGLRATASTILNESGKFRFDVIEKALAHRDNNRVRSAYNQAEYFRERAVMLQWWADYLDLLKTGAVVTPDRFDGVAMSRILEQTYYPFPAAPQE